ALSAFWASWDQLSTSPTDAASRQAVLDSGAALAGQIRSGAAQLTRLGSETLSQAKDAVDQVNRLADQIGRLNVAISDAVVGKQSPNDLMDQRDALVDKLSALTGATVRTGDLQSADVYVGNRAIVRGGTVEKLQIANEAPATVSWALDGAAATAGGKLGALVELSNTTLPGLRSQLDALANGLRDQINTAHQAGKDQDGNAGLAFFTGTGAGDLAVNAALDVRKVAASETGAAADGNNALAIAGLRTAPAVGTNTLQQAIEALAGHLGGLSAAAKGASDASASVLTNIKSERAETSSVSIDEEMANLVRFQHSYEAAAKVITIVDGCLDTLVNLGR
ncbi:MAG: flagellar hook-associated protein FlgK, partial [Pseudonocardia sp.]|nr:flagellar hook-associated protein FlgK [Pseudonocardia sp.]